MRFLCALMVVSAAAGTGYGQPADAMGLFLSSDLGDLRPSADYTAQHHLKQDAGDHDADLSFTEHRLHFRLPISQSSDHEWTVGAGIGLLDFNTDVSFPDTSCLWRRDPFPSELWDLRLDTTYRRRLNNGWILGGQLAVGSPSDRPFAGLDEMVVMFNGSVRIERNESDAWLFFVNYSNNREFLQNIPIPGFGYQFQREKLSGLVGLPLVNLRARPLEWLQLDATYFVPRTIRARVSVEPAGPVSVYAGYNWTNDRYLRHNRRDKDDRLFYYEQNVETGVEWAITESITLDLHGGYAFNRFFFEGEEYDDRSDNRINLDDGPFIGAKLAISF